MIGTGEVVLRASAVRKDYAGVHALRDASLELRAGEIHALVGENGAGKSTLIKVLTGAVAPNDGAVIVDGSEVMESSPHAARRLGIAAIYQQPALFPELTVAENIALANEETGRWGRVHWRERRARARELLRRVGARIEPDVEARELSMPQQQLVDIARALGADARILVFDEPTASLSAEDARNLFDVLHHLRRKGAGIIYITHRLDELPAIADRVTVLRDGCTVGTYAMAEVNRAQLIQLMVGRELSTVFPKREVVLGEPVLELIAVRCRASGVREVSLTVRAGEIVGLAGLVGAGRTELARTIFGITPADAGEIRLHGRAVHVGAPSDAIAQGIAYLPEDRRRHGVVLEMPVAENITLAALRAVSRFGALDLRRERELAQDYTRRLGVKTSSILAPVASLSGGNQQKVALSRWLATKPSVLLLDEPTQGIDVGAKAEIHALMGELAAQGAAILMISSELPEILGMSDRIAVMHGGTIVDTLVRAEATQERILALALDSIHVNGAQAPNATPHEKKQQRAGARDGRNGGLPELSFPRHARELPPAIAYALLLLFVGTAAPSFFSAANVRDLALDNAPKLLVAVGSTVVILTGEIDISVGSQFAVCGVAAAWLAKAGVPMVLVPAAGVLVGAALGAVNGLLVARVGLPSIIVTLATLVAWRDGLQWATQGAWVQDLPADFQWFGLPPLAAQLLIVILPLGVTTAFAWLLRNITVGRSVYAVGSDRESARLAGIDVPRVVLGAFVLTGALVGLAAVLNAVRFAAVPSNAGVGLELEMIAAVVVGGTSITGGRGTVLGTVIGVALLGTISTALAFVGISPQWTQAIQGAIILSALATDVAIGRLERYVRAISRPAVR